MSVRILIGDVRDKLRELPDESVHVVCTSPPYWGLRCYGVDGQVGQEPTYQEHVTLMADVFDEVKRVLRKDGTLWLNYGDSYATSVNGRSAADVKLLSDDDRTFRDKPFSTIQGILKPKDLCGIPWRVAFALQERGWYLRQDIIWAKPNPMPESVKDRCTKAHEYVFLLTKSPRYYFDAEAIREEAEYGYREHTGEMRSVAQDGRRHTTGTTKGGDPSAGRNKRSVWEIATSPFPDAHFATFPPELPEICIKAGTSEKGCCGKCGKPWVRETEAEYTRPRGNSTKQSAKGLDPSSNWSGYPVLNKITTTTGWGPSCQCASIIGGPTTTATVKLPSEHSRIDGDAPMTGCPSRSHPASRKAVANKVEQADRKSLVEPPHPIPCTVLDPFGGAGTTGLVADRLQRNAILIELNPTYAELARKRIDGDAPLFSPMEAAE